MEGTLVGQEALYVETVYYIKAVILKINLNMSKKNKALGIGNAIVDAVCKIEEDFLKSHNLQNSLENS